MLRVCLLLLLCLPSAALAQVTLRGTLRNSRSDQPVADAIVIANRPDGTMAASVTTAIDGTFQFTDLEAGSYVLNAKASSFYPLRYQCVLHARQPLSLALSLEPRETVRENVDVKTGQMTIDSNRTGSSYTFTHEDLEHLPEPLTDTTNSLVTNLMPGASDSHDNFLAVRGTEFSLHEFINGVSFLDNTQPQFSPGISPQLFETVELITGGFTPEYGNRFGGVLDITTRSGADLGGHGSVNLRGATLQNYDLNAEYGNQYKTLGYYFFVDGFTSGRFLDPPEPQALYDFGKGSRATAQFDWRADSNDSLKLLLMGGGDNFQQPNIADDQAVGRDAQRHLRQQTAILNWYHTFSSRTLLATSLYERVGSDRVLPTTDPITPYSSASRSPLTLGMKADLSHSTGSNFFKAGIDLKRLRENESFFFDSRGEPDVFPPFSGGLLGGQVSVYAQDHFTPIRNLTVDLGVRYDYFDLINTGVQTSPRVGLAYRVASKSVLHVAYNRYFSPPPIEYSLLASFIGHYAVDPGQRVGDVHSYTQNYYEAGWSQELRPGLSLELNAYLHDGHNSFENHEISISRIFAPINFHAAKSRGAEFVINLKQLEKIGVSGRFQYALQKTYFYGPITGGFAGDEPLTAGERIIPAFDQTRTGTAQVFYHSGWHGIWAGSALRYGSGTIIEGGARLPQHLTADIASGVTLWAVEPRRLELEFDVTNVSNNIYPIAKESDEIPIQYAPSRTAGGSMRFRF